MNFPLMKRIVEANEAGNAARVDELLMEFLHEFDPDQLPDELAARYYALLDDGSSEASEDSIDRVLATVLGEGPTPPSSKGPTLMDCLEAAGGAAAHGLAERELAELAQDKRPLGQLPQSLGDFTCWLNAGHHAIPGDKARVLYHALKRGWRTVGTGGPARALSLQAAREDKYRA